MTIPVIYGRELLPAALPPDKKWIVISIAPLADFLKTRVRGLGEIIDTPSLDEAFLEKWADALPEGEAVLGIGGGACLDAAKYLAWRRKLPLWLAPSIVSADACLTEAIGVRRDRRVNYVGEVFPESVLVDFELIQSAPAHLNRAGAGDILSIHTALWDWQIAAQMTGERYDAAIAGESRQLLKKLDDAAEEIREVTEDGIRALMDLYAAEIEMCHRAGSSRPEEGSEHFWAYNAEYCTKRGYVHGELVALGVLAMAALQDNDFDAARRLIDKLEIRYRPDQIGLSDRELTATLITARDYADLDQLAYSVLTARPVSLDKAVEIVYRINRG